MQDEEVRLDIQDVRVICDKITFSLFSIDIFTRKYIVGEVPGVIFPLSTVVSVYQLDGFNARVFPLHLPAITEEDREAHFRVSEKAGAIVWQDYASQNMPLMEEVKRMFPAENWSWICVSIFPAENAP